MAHCQSARLVCGRSWVRIHGRVIPITLKVVHTASLPSTRHWKDRVWSSSHHAINGGAVYRESHPRARERTHIPERIGLCGPLSSCELYHHVALHQSMRCHLAAKFATRSNKASNMACHNGQNVAVCRTTNNNILCSSTRNYVCVRRYISCEFVTQSKQL